MLVEIELEDVVNAVIDRLRLYRKVLLCGNVTVHLTNEEVQEWETYCHANQNYVQFMKALQDREIWAIKYRHEPSDFNEEKYRSVMDQYNDLEDAMTVVASEWANKLSEDRPH